MFRGPSVVEREARRARRLESIYHVGQSRIWDGRQVLAELKERHGPPRMGADAKRALSRVFSIIMWGELAAWKISAQLADALVPLEAKLAAASQVHDEARHFYVMHDYLSALGHEPPPLDFWSQRVVEMTLETEDLAKKLLGMQLTIETIALTLFQHVRELRVDPLLAELLAYYERDEARHVGLGIQLVPDMIAAMSATERVSLALFQLDILASSLFSLKAMEHDLEVIGVDPRDILAIGLRKQLEVQDAIKKQFPRWPNDSVVDRLFHGLIELLFPSAPKGAPFPLAARVAGAASALSRARGEVLATTERRRAVASDQARP